MVSLSIAGVSPVAYAAKDMSQDEINRVLHSWKVRCSDLAVAENQPALEEQCRAGVRSGMKELADLSMDDKVSEVVWNLCRNESGFGYTGDFHSWAACIRVAKTRAGLRIN